MCAIKTESPIMAAILKELGPIESRLFINGEVSPLQLF